MGYLFPFKTIFRLTTQEISDKKILKILVPSLFNKTKQRNKELDTKSIFNYSKSNCIDDVNKYKVNKIPFRENVD